MSNIWRRWLTIEGFACMWIGETNFRDNQFHPSACLQKFNRLLNTFDELCDAECIALNWEDDETFLNELFLHFQRFRGQGNPLLDVPHSCISE